MEFKNKEIMEAFNIYSKLALKGYEDSDEIRLYNTDDKVRELVDGFAHEVQCTIILAGEYIYMVPIATTSPFHISNEEMKKRHLPSKAVNLDIYLMYLTIIILFGEFYDSYQSLEPTRDFLPIYKWLESVNTYIETLNEIDKEELKSLEKEYEYNWIGILEKWNAMDDLRENVKSQNARTNSRLGFLSTVKRFLESQDLIIDIGNDEIELTEKSKVIIQRYYMDYEYNRGILDFIYGLERERREDKDAIHI
ncbi:DUF6063 family protein [Anaerosalibacter bizertensis]|uniref:DUF6063 family protein n=1 Tax=Anaerosalibacter bizertensis TaxID=932217 RepID=A0A9Q4AD58_9FIRM|nr:DUF6063 family protein [Anaerosalibacter bizertensis]MBV1821112.1 hypothetical protein [Bacteroidales bacterium MSK.15.36]MCG4565368.1 DUF6063 family protein [Anaerosalibacter bizertensis]MCG4582443.1 DUF6063 family protein [Anaerosalibacter bizertensis]